MPKSTIVVNSTPIILLEKIGHIDLLKKLYGKIYVPQAVYQEITTGDDSENMQEFFTNNSWIEIVQIQNTDAKKTFTSSLHSGEVETIILAMEKSADLCIFDDLLARKHAKRLNLNLTGTLGIIIAAKQTGFIDSVKPLLDKLIAVDMYISDKLYNTVLSQAGE